LAFFIRAITLPNMMVGLRFFLEPKAELLMNPIVWQRAAVQIFYSLGVGFGSLIAFASKGKPNDPFITHAKIVTGVNCGTSMFAGFVVFPILGYLAWEMKEVNPCIGGDDLADLQSIGLSGTGLAFIAFPIAISKMAGSFFWAFMFFLMLLCLGIDSEFGMIESIVTVIEDAKVTKMKTPAIAGIVCGISWFFGLIFLTKGGIYWFQLFDYYTCVIAMFFVTLMECFWLMWGGDSYKYFKKMVEERTDNKITAYFEFSWKYTCPIIISILSLLAFGTTDLMQAETSEPYPLGTGKLPMWSISLGWKLGLLPLAAFGVLYVVKLETSIDNANQAKDIAPA